MQTKFPFYRPGHRVKSLMGCFLLFGLAIVATADPTAAQESNGVPDRPSQLVEKLFSCREIAEDFERLACFDKEVAVVDQATRDKDLVIADREQIREARRGLFGLTLPSINLFDDGDENAEQVDMIEAVIVDATTTSAGKVYFMLKDGAKWIQTDSMQVLGRAGKGDRVVIRQAAMGSYMASINDRRAFRVKRVN